MRERARCGRLLWKGATSEGKAEGTGLLASSSKKEGREHSFLRFLKEKTWKGEKGGEDASSGCEDAAQ